MQPKKKNIPTFFLHFSYEPKIAIRSAACAAYNACIHQWTGWLPFPSDYYFSFWENDPTLLLTKKKYIRLRTKLYIKVFWSRRPLASLFASRFSSRFRWTNLIDFDEPHEFPTQKGQKSSNWMPEDTPLAKPTDVHTTRYHASYGLIIKKCMYYHPWQSCWDYLGTQHESRGEK